MLWIKVLSNHLQNYNTEIINFLVNVQCMSHAVLFSFARIALGVTFARIGGHPPVKIHLHLEPNFLKYSPLLNLCVPPLPRRYFIFIHLSICHSLSFPKIMMSEKFLMRIKTQSYKTYKIFNVILQ